MDVLALKRHGLKIVRVSPIVLFVSIVAASLVGYFWVFSALVLVAGTILGSALFYCNFRYWISGNSAYWFMGVMGAGVLPAISLKSFHSLALLMSIEAIVFSALVMINKKRLVSALS